MNTERFMELVRGYDHLGQLLDALKYDLLVEGGDEMQNLSPRGKRRCNRIRLRMWKLRGEMDTMENTIIDFVQDTKFDRDFQLQLRLGTDRLKSIQQYYRVDHRASEHIQLDDGREISEFIG